MIKIMVAYILLIFMTTAVYAGFSDKLGRLVGYTIVSSVTITGWYEDGKKKEGFEGCNYGRIIVFDDNTSLVCTGYNYQYGYRPTAIIVSNGSSFKMIVEDEIYDMSR